VSHAGLNPFHGLAWSCFAGLALLTPCVAAAQDGSGVSGGPGPINTADLAGARLDDIEIQIDGVTDPAAASALEQEVRAALGLSVGDPLDLLSFDRAIGAAERVAGVATIKWRLDRAIAPQLNTLVLSVKAGSDQTAAAKSSSPLVLHRGQRSFLRIMANGGFGVFSDGNPWFRNAETFTRGNPLVQDPQIGADTGKRATWTEMYFEYGLAGVAPLGIPDVYLYGAATATTVASIGEDIYRDDSRSTTSIEKLYAGLLYAPANGTRINLGVGRQNFSLNEGFLVNQYGPGAMFNAGPRPGIYLAPRTTSDFSTLLTIKSGKLVSTSFFINPNEYKPIESNTKLAGTNLRYNFTKSAALDVSYINIVNSDASIATPNGPNRGREGIQTISVHGRWADAGILPGVWLDGEVAHQWHNDYDMNAWAGYGLVGYIARDVSWSPSISYRFASFSGDDPDTQTFERFDPLFSGGLGEWLQGISIGKALLQANRQTHRIRTNVSPDPRLNLTFDIFFHRANELNNRGGNRVLTDLISRDLGMEYQWVTRWAISPRVYFVGVVSRAEPGDAIRAVTPREARPWSTLQAQFYFNF
jgi:hypothetical protein